MSGATVYGVPVCQPLLSRVEPGVIWPVGHSYIGGSSGVPGWRLGVKRWLAARGFVTSFSGSQNAAGGQGWLDNVYADDYRHDGTGGLTISGLQATFASLYATASGLSGLNPHVCLLSIGENDVGTLTTEAQFVAAYDALFREIQRVAEFVPIVMVGGLPRIDGTTFEVIDQDQWIALRQAQFATVRTWNARLKRGVRYVDTWNLIAPALYNHEGSSTAGCLSFYVETGSDTRIHPNEILAIRVGAAIFEAMTGESATVGVGSSLSSEILTSFASDQDYPEGVYLQKSSSGSVAVTTVDGERVTITDADLARGAVWPTPIVRIHSTGATVTRAVVHRISLDGIGDGASSLAGVSVASEPPATPYQLACDGTDELLVASTARELLGGEVMHLNDAPIYLKFYDKATAPSESDTPIHVVMAPASGTAALGGATNPSFCPIALTNGLGIRVVKGIAASNDTGVDASEVLVNVRYR